MRVGGFMPESVLIPEGGFIPEGFALEGERKPDGALMPDDGDFNPEGDLNPDEGIRSPGDLGDLMEDEARARDDEGDLIPVLDLDSADVDLRSDGELKPEAGDRGERAEGDLRPDGDLSPVGDRIFEGESARRGEPLACSGLFLTRGLEILVPTLLRTALPLLFVTAPADFFFLDLFFNFERIRGKPLGAFSPLKTKNRESVLQPRPPPQCVNIQLSIKVVMAQANGRDLTKETAWSSREADGSAWAWGFEHGWAPSGAGEPFLSWSGRASSSAGWTASVAP